MGISGTCAQMGVHHAGVNSRLARLQAEEHEFINHKDTTKVGQHDAILPTIEDFKSTSLP
jgi:hypothetical protein